MIRYFVTMIVDVPRHDDPDRKDVERALKDAATNRGWEVASVTVAD
jgi:hypothetical protein